MVMWRKRRSSSEDGPRPARVAREAEALRKMGRPHDALELVASAVRRSPDNATLQEALSRTYAVLARWDDAIGAGRRAIALEPDNWIKYTALAAACLDAERPREAIEPALQAIRLQPDNRYGYVRAAEALRCVDELDRALDYARTAVGLAPGDHDHLMGRVLLTMGCWQDAEREFERAQRRYPAAPGLAFHHALALIPQGRGDEATTMMRDLLRNSPDHRIGRLLWERLESWHEAETSLRHRAGASAPPSGVVEHLALLLIAQERLDEAALVLERGSANDASTASARSQLVEAGARRDAMSRGERYEPTAITILERELAAERLRLVEHDAREAAQRRRSPDRTDVSHVDDSSKS